MSEHKDMEAVIAAAREAADPQLLDPEKPQVLLIPEGSRLEYPDLRFWKAAPERQSGVYEVGDVDSFLAYVTSSGLQEFATIWVDSDAARVVGVLNDHDAEIGPGWSDWRVTLNLKPTPEWLFWTREDGKLMDQVSFAEHVEEGQLDIEEPPGADLLEMAQSMHATNEATFRSSVRLQSGEQQFAYDESINAGAAGTLTIPKAILLVLAPFVGEPGITMSARFRYRLRGGQLTLGYKLDRPDRIRNEAIERVLSRLQETFKHTYLGKPRPLV